MQFFVDVFQMHPHCFHADVQAARTGFVEARCVARRMPVNDRKKVGDSLRS